MTESQIDYLWELAGRDGEQADLQAQFPDVDWAAAQARKEAQWQAMRAQRAHNPQPAITAAQVEDAIRTVFTPERVRALFEGESPLLGKRR